MSKIGVFDLRVRAAAVALVVVGYLVLGLLPAGAGREIPADLAMTLAAAGAGVATILGARRRHGATRRSWLSLGSAAVVWSLGQAVFTFYDLRSQDVPFPGLGDVGFLGATPLLVFGILVHPTVAERRLSRLRLALDGTVVAGALLLVSVAVLPGAFRVDGPLTATVIGLAYPIGDVLVLAAATAALSRAVRGERASMVLVWLGAWGLLIADGAFAWGTDRGIYATGWFTDAGWVAGFLLLWLASCAPGAVPGRAEIVDSGAGRLVGVLPYVAVIGGLAVTVISYARGSPVTSVHVVIGTALVVAMVVQQAVAALDAQAATRHLAREEAYFRSIVQGASDVMTIVDPDFVVRWQSPSVRTNLGLEEDGAVGKRLHDLIHPDDVEAALATMTAVLDGSTPDARLYARVPDGNDEWRHTESTVADHRATPAVRGIVIHTRDITERKLLEEQLEAFAFTDGLTGVANRRLFLDRLTQALARLHRLGEPCSVAALDLDGFKAVNDIHGHGVGDHLLVGVAMRLGVEVREIDTVARLGGDEFAVLVLGSAEDAVAMAERLVLVTSEPYRIRGNAVHVSVSVGVAAARPEDDADAVLRNADIALLRAKARGKRRVEVYDPVLHEAARIRRSLEHDLGLALERDQVSLAYQPIFDLASDTVIGIEALMRWRHPERGYIPPNVFVPLAEDTGHIQELGSWALEASCRQLAAWVDAGHDLRLGVNVSMRQLRDSSGSTSPFYAEVAAVLASCRLDPARLVLEMTESVFLDEVDTAATALRVLHASGVRVALDDFGTGYSSLSYLSRLPVDILKIDSSFVSGISAAAGIGTLVEVVVELGNRLGIDVVAEGIETAGQVAALLAIGCRMGQGFHFAPPRPAALVTEFLERRRDVPAPR